jgi:hypothetical protein
MVDNKVLLVVKMVHEEREQFFSDSMSIYRINAFFEVIHSG